MARIAPPRTPVTIGGAAVGAAGLLLLVRAFDTGGAPALLPVAALALAAGCVLLATRRGVMRSRAGSIALVAVGVLPLLDALPLRSVVAGMTLVWAVTIATVVAAIELVRAGRTRGLARWTFVVVAADAVAVALLSTVPLEGPSLLSVQWHLDLVRPAALLVWGAAVAVQPHLPAIRRRLGDLDAAWRASTAVDGTAPAPDRVPLD